MSSRQSKWKNFGSKQSEKPSEPPPMRFAIDLSCLTPPSLTGIGVYAESLARHLPKNLLDGESLEAWLPTRKAAKAQLVRERSQLPLQLFNEITRWTKPVGLVHGPDFKVPKRGPFKKVVTVHDLVEFEPEFANSEFMQQARKNFSKMLFEHKPDHIICISDFTQQKIREHFPHLKVPVTRIYHGADHCPARDPARPRLRPNPYLLFVGTLEKRKNPMALIEAFEIFKAKNTAANLELVLAGGLGPDGQHLLERIRTSPVASSIFHRHGITRTELESLYQHAEAFVLPTLYEGFGFPVLEAMRMGTPVITSNFGAVREIAGSAACLVEPRNPQAIAEGIESILSQSSFRQELCTRGPEQAAKFTWQQCACETLDVYRRTLTSA